LAIGMPRSLSRELGIDGITVNAITPRLARVEVTNTSQKTGSA
jgi:NAD(P)-dependent dehydrogenase (short-subunit alcohol dehydrogenase family)